MTNYPTVEVKKVKEPVAEDEIVDVVVNFRDVDTDTYVMEEDGTTQKTWNTTYTFKMVKPIDLDEEMEYLIINEGRFSSNRNVPLCDVTDVHIAKTFFGLDYCVVIEYGHNNIVTVQPDNEEAFMERIKNK